MISFLLCLAILIVGYFVYGKIVDNTFGPDDRETPAVRINDGVDYVVMPQWKLFLVQLLNIAGLGPIFGALQGALWGPVVFLWITFGGIFMGAAHDFIAGGISLRHDGASLPETAGVYLGGGTPSYLGGARLERILHAVRGSFALAEETEITVECNPESTDAALLDALRRGGANRLSFGVQAAHDNELRRIGRIHDFAKAKNAVLLAHEHGFSNISLDLMYGLPGQTQDMFLDSLAQCLALQPTHLSCYGLKLEPMTEMGREAPVLPDDDAQADTYLALCRVLRQHGFEHYEISNFALPGFRSRHNSKYWDLSEYIGLGPGAHSLFDGRRFAFPRDIAGFTDGTAAVRNEEEVPDFERQNEYLMLRLRTSDGVELRDLEERYHVDPAPYEAVFRALAKPGLTEQNGTRWHLTDAGFLVSNSIINMITDAASR